MRWLCRAIALLATLVVVSIPMLFVGIFLGPSNFLHVFGPMLLGYAASVIFIAVPGLWIFDRADVRTLLPRICLGLVAGVVAIMLGDWRVLTADHAIRPWLLGILRGLVLGLFGALAYALSIRAVTNLITSARERVAHERWLRTLDPDQRREFRSRSDRDHW